MKSLTGEPRIAGPRADVAVFERLTQALVGMTTQSLVAVGIKGPVAL